MAIEYRGNVVVLDNGKSDAADLLERVTGVFPHVYRMTAHAMPDAAEHVLAVGSKHLNVKSVIHEMYENEAYWALIPHDGDPVVVVADLLSAARPHLADGFPGFVLIAGHPGRRYRRIAAVADVREPFTTGSLALAAVGLAWRTGAQMDVLLLGGDPDDPPANTSEARDLFRIDEGATLLEQALDKAREIGLTVTWKALGESTDRDRLVLDAVRDADYDLVIDDLRPIDVGPRIGRLKRVQKQLIAGDHIDTAYRLLRDAPCDVAIIVDAVRMQLVPANYVKAGAVAALSLGVLGAAALPTATMASAAETTTIEAPVDPEGEAAPTDAAAEAAAPVAAAPAPAAVGTPPPTVDAIPAEVSADQMAAGEEALAAEQAALAAEQAELAALQQQQAAADQAVALARSDVALEKQDVYDAEATLESAEEALDYAEGSGDSLSESEESQALGSYNRALHDVEDQEADVAEAEAALEAAQAQADSTAAAAAAQQAVVDAQAANVAGWGTVVTEAEARTDQIVAPVQGYSVTTNYGVAGSNWSSGYHTGTDFAAPAGTPIYAAADGVVISAGYAGPYGNQTVIQHEDGTTTTYAHQSEITVEVGESVQAGEEIGKVGTTGNSTGPHLHFEVFDAQGNRLNPEEWLGDAI